MSDQCPMSHPSQTARNSDRPTGDRAGGGPLLVVEDDAPLAQMLGWEFSDRGYHAAVAGSDGEARALAASQRFRCALIDLMLPDGDGHRLAQSLIKRDPALRVILCTGSHGARPPGDLGPGILAFLTKPVDLAMVDRLFGAAFPADVAS